MRDPSTYFRGAGFISLENLLFFAKTFSTSFQHLVKKQDGKRVTWEYPFVVAGVNITFMLIQMLDLDACLALANRFFEDHVVGVPPAISTVMMSLMGFSLVMLWAKKKK